MQFQNFYSPLPPTENFFPRLHELEIYLYEGCLTHETFKELFELYSKAQIHYESQGLVYEFSFYIQKMQNLLKDEKIIPLLKRRKSRDLAENISNTIKEKKQKIENIKKLFKENKKETKQLASELLKNFKESETNQADILKKELSLQVQNFQKKLELKKKEKNQNGRSRVFSLPHTRIYNMIRQSTDASERIENSIQALPKRRGTIIKKSTTPARKKSILSINAFKEEDEAENSEEEKIHINRRIESELFEMWKTAEIAMKEELKKIELEMEIFLDDLAEEKIKGILEINSRYDQELKNNENNVHTIVYNQVIKDKEKELSEFYKLIDEKKRNKLTELRVSSDRVRINLFEDKSKFAVNLKSKIPEDTKLKNISTLEDSGLTILNIEDAERELKMKIS